MHDGIKVKLNVYDASYAWQVQEKDKQKDEQKRDGQWSWCLVLCRKGKIFILMKYVCV